MSDKGSSIRCSGMHFRGYHGYPCGNRATTEDKGKPYCRVCNPAIKEEKRKTREAKWRAEYEKKEARWKDRRKISELGQNIIKAAKEWRISSSEINCTYLSAAVEKLIETE